VSPRNYFEDFSSALPNKTPEADGAVSSATDYCNTGLCIPSSQSRCRPEDASTKQTLVVQECKSRAMARLHIKQGALPVDGTVANTTHKLEKQRLLLLSASMDRTMMLWEQEPAGQVWMCTKSVGDAGQALTSQIVLLWLSVHDSSTGLAILSCVDCSTVQQAMCL
jgi:hypothetical protein